MVQYQRAHPHAQHLVVLNLLPALYWGRPFLHHQQLLRHHQAVFLVVLQGINARIQEQQPIIISVGTVAQFEHDVVLEEFASQI
jgi:hypothetical protein